MKFTIKERREKLGLSQQELANELNISMHTVWRWENEKIEPRASELIALAKIFKCPMKKLFEENPPQPSTTENQRLSRTRASKQQRTAEERLTA